MQKSCDALIVESHAWGDLLRHVIRKSMRHNRSSARQKVIRFIGPKIARIVQHIFLYRCRKKIG